MIKKTVVFLFLLSGELLSGQKANVSQAANDFRLVNQAYTQSEKLQMSIGYTLFPSYTSTVPYQVQSGVFFKEGTNTYSDLLGIVSLRNSKVCMTLDSNEQAIVVTDPVKQKDLNPSIVDLDSMLRICSSIEYGEIKGVQKIYKLHFDQTPFFEYNAIDVYVNSNTHLLDRIILYFRVEIDLDEEEGVYSKDRPRLEITYSSVNTHPVFSPGQFSETRFIRSSGGNISCAPAYSAYRLVNNKIK